MTRPRAPEEARRRAASAWLEDAEADLASARSLSLHRDEGTAPFGAAFHAQQAVEKSLKALLIWHGIEYPSRHDLGLLVGLLPEGTPVKDLRVAGLTVYAVDQRYVAGSADPMDLVERPTWDEADEAIAIAEKAVPMLTQDLTAGGWIGDTDRVPQRPDLRRFRRTAPAAPR